MSAERNDEAEEISVTVDDLHRVTSDVFSVKLKCLLLACPSCGNSVPLNGLLSRFDCPSCSSPVILSSELWSSIIELDWRTAVMKPFSFQPVSEAREHTSEGSDLRVQVERTFLQNPCCIHCSEPLVGVVGAVPRETFSVSCSSCGERNDFFEQPEAFADKDVAVTHVAATELETSSAQATPKQRTGGGQLVVMSCPNCSGGLKITTGSQRTTQCEFCSASVYIPDDLWRQLHPVKTTKTWEVMYRINPGALHEAAKQKKIDAMGSATLAMVGGGVFSFIWLALGLWHVIAPSHPSRVISGYIDLALGGGILLVAVILALFFISKPRALIGALKDIAEQLERKA